MATNSNNNGGNGQRPAGSGRNLPEAHRDLQDRDPPEAVRDLPAVDREPELRTDRRECLPNSVQPRREKRLSSLA